MPEKKRRTSVIVVRLEPKLRYLTEIAARVQRRTLSGFVAWVIEQAMQHIFLPSQSESLGREADHLWDPDETKRFAKLARRHPDLLAYDEQVRWKKQSKQR